MNPTNPTETLHMNRRRVLLSSLAAAGSVAAASAVGQQAFASGVFATPASEPLTLLKTLKIGMVRAEGGFAEKFAIAKKAGFDGIELDAPGFEVDDIKEAIRKTGLPVDGSVCSTHWQIKHSSPKADERAQALKDLKHAIETTHAVGGHTVLLVVGHGNDGPESEIIPRSIENISKAIPLASRLGIVIAVENVWNKFLYDHDGPNNQSADRFAKYIDAFNSPWVGMQFDIGNHWKYGNPAEWIRTLGKRIVKLDTKGFSREKNAFTEIANCDLPWSQVRQALVDIKFSGWCAAEVGGGGLEDLTRIAKEMDQTLGPN